MKFNEEQKELLSILQFKEEELKGKKLTDSQKLVYAHLCLCNDTFSKMKEESNGWFIRSYEGLRKGTGISSDSTIRTAIDVLFNLGLIKYKQGTATDRLANQYFIPTIGKNCSTTEKNCSAVIDFEKCSDEERLNFLKGKKLNKSAVKNCSTTEKNCSTTEKNCSIDIEIDIEKEKEIELDKEIDLKKVVMELQKEVISLRSEVEELKSRIPSTTLTLTGVVSDATSIQDGKLNKVFPSSSLDEAGTVKEENEIVPSTGLSVNPEGDNIPSTLVSKSAPEGENIPSSNCIEQAQPIEEITMVIAQPAANNNVPTLTPPIALTPPSPINSNEDKTTVAAAPDQTQNFNYNNLYSYIDNQLAKCCHDEVTAVKERLTSAIDKNQHTTDKEKNELKGHLLSVLYNIASKPAVPYTDEYFILYKQLDVISNASDAKDWAFNNKRKIEALSKDERKELGKLYKEKLAA